MRNRGGGYARFEDRGSKSISSEGDEGFPNRAMGTTSDIVSVARIAAENSSPFKS